MQFSQIEEPATKKGLNQIIVGIDFGTTNSLVAIMIEGKITIIPDERGSILTPSILSISESGISTADHAYPGCYTVRSIKRLLGKEYLDICSMPMLAEEIKKLINPDTKPLSLKLGTKLFSLVDVAATIFKKLRLQAELYLEQIVQHAVVTVPAYFTTAQRIAVKQAASKAGLKVLRLVAEPTAAAYAYGSALQGQYLVYDLGGGTFDISIINIENQVVQVLAVGGDSMLGGDDIDHLLSKYLQRKYQWHDGDFSLQLAKQLKEILSKMDIASITVGERKIILLLEEFEAVIRDIIDRTIELSQQVVQEAEIKEIKGCILVGGSTRINMIARLLAVAFNTKVFATLDPEQVVAMGAAMYAKNINDNQQYLLVDVNPLSLGIETMGGIAEKIIMHNTPIPYAVTKYFTTQVDNQTGIVLNLVQGEREMVKDLQLLASFELKGIPPMQAGQAKVAVTFSLDLDGLLTVKALEERTGIYQQIVININNGLDDEQIRVSIDEAMMYAAQDYNMHQYQELRNEVTITIDQARKLYQALKDTEDTSLVAQLIEDIEKVATANDITAMRQILNDLKSAMHPLAKLYANQQLEKLINRQVTDIY